jgi:hypothetical protein
MGIFTNIAAAASKHPRGAGLQDHIFSNARTGRITHIAAAATEMASMERESGGSRSWQGDISKAQFAKIEKQMADQAKARRS